MKKVIHKEMTVNQVIRLYPIVISVFNKFNIDSCCGGSDTLEAAAKKGNIDIEELLRELNLLLEKGGEGSPRV